MNYIKRLQAVIRENQEVAKEMRQQLALLEVHLLSSKFHTDPTVQSKDVLHWLGHLKETISKIHEPAELGKVLQS